MKEKIVKGCGRMKKDWVYLLFLFVLLLGVAVLYLMEALLYP